MGVHGQVEAAVKAAGEFLGAVAHLAFRAVHVQWQTNDDGVRLPFLDQRFELLPVRHAVLCLEDAQLTGLAGDDLADRNADLFAAVIETQQQA